jgi:hypothetical protein
MIELEQLSDPDIVKELKWAQDNPDEFRKKIYGEKKKRDEGMYMKIYYNMLDHPEWRKDNRNSFGFWLYMCSYIQRKPSPNDKYDIYRRYYCDGKLACFMSIRKMAKDFGYPHESKTQVKRWIKKLFDDGAFTKEFIDVGKRKSQTVYILGELKTVYDEKTNENIIHEILYYNDRFK